MFEINIILSLFFFILFSFFDFIVFNEEILLTLCFLAFIFFCFNTLSETVFLIFETRALKFEEELLTTFNSSKNLLVSEFNTNLMLQFFINKFTILMVSLIHYLNVCKILLEFKSSWVFYQASLSKLNDLSLSNKKFTILFQKACVIQLLYSLILKKSNNDLTFLSYKLTVSKKLIDLKNLSFF